MSARDEIIAMLTEFLERTSERELQEASVFLSPDALMIFPGGFHYRSLSEMAEGATRRYRWVKKRIERWDVLPATEDGATTVYCLGTLFGEDLAGEPFEGVRFIDRFEVKDGLIRLQEVWNDFGQAKVGVRS